VSSTDTLLELIFETPVPDTDALTDLLLAHGALAVSVEDAAANSAQEVPLFGEPGAPRDLQSWPRSKIILLLSADTDVKRWWAGVCVDEPGLTDIPFETRQVVNKDWVHETQRQFQPFVIADRLWVGPSWLTPPAPIAAQGVAISLDPGMAFGTGSHATTQLCLEQLLTAMTNQPAARVLDYGCGSGILGIAAARLGAAEVVALDIDPLAIDASLRNAKDNQVTLHLATADDAVEGHFDIVLANILSQPLKVLAPLLAGRVKPGGALLMSGILERQAQEIIDAYLPHTAHLSLPTVLATRDGWVCVGCVGRNV
jgi:ribosomal protein L11 methyltransferase